MGKDMTYEPVTDVTTLRRTAQEANQYALYMEDKANELATRVQELEHQLAQADSNMVALAARNAELAARLEAVPVEALRFWRNPFGGNLTAERIDTAWDAITAWLDAPEAQPDDTDAPLTLAAIDEDGDE